MIMIDTSGKWWKGSNFEDLKKYLVALTSEGYPVTLILQSACKCGNKKFHIQRDGEESFSKRVCTVCNTVTFIADSEDFLDDASPKKLKCVGCKNDEYIIGIGFSFRENKQSLSFFRKNE